MLYPSQGLWAAAGAPTNAAADRIAAPTRRNLPHLFVFIASLLMRSCSPLRAYARVRAQRRQSVGLEAPLVRTHLTLACQRRVLPVAMARETNNSRILRNRR